MEQIMQDVRYALRQLRRSPAFSFVIVLTLSLGIGSAAAVFSVIDAVMLRPLPFANQDRLVFPDTTAREGYEQPWSYLSYVDARPELKTFEALAGYSEFGKVNLEGPSGPIALQAVKGTDNFFDIFGVKPLLGRTYRPGEDQPGRDDIAVLSNEVWKTQFGGQADVVGKVVRMDGLPYTIIGVMPAGFRFPLSVRNAIYTPLHPDPRWKNSRGSHWMRTVGLLKPGVSREQAQADFSRVLTDLGRAYPDTDQGRTVKVVPLRVQVNGKTDGPLKTLLFAVLALLAIACVNVAGLLLARGVKREREIALRAAVGAGRMRLIRQMVTESLVLSLAGLAGGIAVSWALLATMRTFLVEGFARGADVQMNLSVLGAAVLFSAVTSVVASLAPALRLSGTDPNRALRAGGSAGTGIGQHRLRSSFVITQVALSLVLLVISGLLLKNLQSLLKADLGFDPKTILTLDISLSPGVYEHRDPLSAFYQPLLERVAQLPGVTGVGVVNMLPVRDWGSNSDIHIAGQPPYPPNQEMLAEDRFVSAGYFQAMGIPLVRGRMLSPALDTPDHPAGSIVVNEAFRRKFFLSGGDPVGARLDDNGKAEEKTNIVGVVGNVRQNLYRPPLAEMDWLIDELPLKDRLGYLANMSLMIHSTGDLAALSGSLRGIVHDIDPTVPFKTPETMTEIVSESVVFERMENWLFGIFAAFALLLASVGLYGLIQHEVELRTREIGIRMALGSSRVRILLQVMRRVALLMVAGVSIGWVLTLALRRVMTAVVVIHAAHDTLLLAGVTALLVTVGLLASLAPARRASSIDPMQTLRSE